MTWKGNPKNEAPNQLQNDQGMSNVKKTENRAENVRRDQDTNKDFTVELMDIDTAIFEYLDNVISPMVVNNGQNIKVPIFYVSQEKWKSVQKDGYIRDQQGKIQLPAIIFKRASFEKNQNMLTLNRYLTYPIIKRFDEKNKYDNFSVLNKSCAPNHQVFAVTLPDHITITYEFTAWTEFITQMNDIIQKINFATEEYWGDPNRFRFRVYISDYAFTTENPSDQDRVVKSTFSSHVNAYLLEGSFEDRKLTTQRFLTPRKLIFTTETCVDNLPTNNPPEVTDVTPVDSKAYTFKSGVIMPMSDAYRFPYNEVTASATSSLLTELSSSNSI